MLKKIGRIFLFLLGILLLVVLSVPFLIPVPPLTGMRSIEELADPDSQFVDVNGVNIHYKIAGSGEPVMILLHGFASSTASWQRVMEPLSQQGTVVAFDRPAFGLSARPLNWGGQNPYSPEAQADLVVGLMDQLGVEQAILVGNSAGGSIAAYTALRHPERVTALALVDPAIYSGGGAPGWAKLLLKTPQMRHLGPLVARSLLSRSQALIQSAWHDPAKVTSQTIDDYRKFTQLADWDKALWELTIASRDLHLDQRLAELKLPVLVITGDDDRIVPTEESIRLSKALPAAELVVIPNCGHVPQEECPEPFVQALVAFIENLHVPH
jgi:pimeloyl-ACP methyl ester carboxylesterase